MSKKPHARSIFSQTLDQAVFVAYFLGAVVPLLAFAAVVQRYALPELGKDSQELWTAIGGMAAVALLSLAAFFALRRLVHGALQRMNADNRRLRSILKASQELTQAPDSRVVAEVAARCALAVSEARAVFMFSDPRSGKASSLCDSVGEGASSLQQSCEDQLMELVEAAVETGRIAQLDASGDADAKTRSAGGLRAAVAVPLAGEDTARGAIVAAHVRSGARFRSEQLDSMATLAAFTSVAFRSADLQGAQRNFFAHVTEILVAALDAQLDAGDPRAGHAKRIAAIANRLGRELGLDEDRLQRLHFASLLHDIGLLKIDRALHVSPEQCKNHPVLGHRMLSRIRLWEEVAPVVLYHHEWFDGSGYPENRAGAQIPLESRIIAVADGFDELTHEGFEHPSMSLEQALAELESRSGQQHDPRVVDALSALAQRGEVAVLP
jgi:HD-GYP domain-containing protein (c-di-GMP phosphodiesterase class II)